MSMDYAGFLYAGGAAIVWGLVYTIDQRILSAVSPFGLLFIDSVLTMLIMLPFVIFDSQALKPLFHSSSKTFILMISSVALAALAGFLIFSGIKRIGAAEASIIEISYPFFVILFTYLIFKSKLNIYFLLGGLLVFLGSAIIIKFA